MFSLGEEQAQRLPWVVKHRPSAPEQVVGRGQTLSVFTRLARGRLGVPNLLLHGPPGTGKTTCAHIIAAAASESRPGSTDALLGGIFSKSLVLSLNASDERGIRVVRERIADFARGLRPSDGRKRTVILDEVDAMTHAAMTALKRTMETHRSSTTFILICNDPTRVNEALVSRCGSVEFHPLSQEDVRGVVEQVLAEEKVTASARAVDAACELSRGDLRKALNTLQAAALMALPETHLEEEDVRRAAGAPSRACVEAVYAALLRCLRRAPEDSCGFEEALRRVSGAMASCGADPRDVFDAVGGRARQPGGELRKIAAKKAPHLVVRRAVEALCLAALAEACRGSSAGLDEALLAGQVVGAFFVGGELLEAVEEEEGADWRRSARVTALLKEVVALTDSLLRCCQG